MEPILILQAHRALADRISGPWLELAHGHRG
jgi:hypothetical protein